MSRAVKDLIEVELKKQYGSLDSVMVVSVHGLTGTAVNTLRGELRKKKIEVHVVKNRAAKRVFGGTVLEPLGKVLKGPCAFVTGGTGPAETAKELIRLTKEYPALEMKFGLVDGEPDILSIDEISKRLSKAEMQGRIVMLAVSPARKVAGCLKVGGKVAGCIKAIIDKLEKGETIKQVA
jgi:large subunit ribosomal protein L10